MLELTQPDVLRRNGAVDSSASRSHHAGTVMVIGRVPVASKHVLLLLVPARHPKDPPVEGDGVEKGQHSARERALLATIRSSGREVCAPGLRWCRAVQQCASLRPESVSRCNSRPAGY